MSWQISSLGHMFLQISYLATWKPVEAQNYAQKMFEADPLYELLSLGCRWGPWKIQLFKAWSVHSDVLPKSQGHSTNDQIRYQQRRKRATGALKVLKATVNAIQEDRMLAQAWTYNSNDNNMVFGWVKALLDWGVICQTGSGPPLRLSCQGGAFWFSFCEEAALARLRALAAAADVFKTSLRLVAKPPTSAAKWLRALDLTRKGVQSLRPWPRSWPRSCHGITSFTLLPT